MPKLISRPYLNVLQTVQVNLSCHEIKQTMNFIGQNLLKHIKQIH